MSRPSAAHQLRGRFGRRFEPDIVAGNCLKTQMCKFHAQGRCHYGSACAFAHEPGELRERVDLAKTSLCRAFKRGACTDRECPFAHGKAELRVVLPTRRRQRPAAPIGSGGPRATPMRSSTRGTQRSDGQQCARQWHPQEDSSAPTSSDASDDGSYSVEVGAGAALAKMEEQADELTSPGDWEGHDSGGSSGHGSSADELPPNLEQPVQSAISSPTSGEPGGFGMGGQSPPAVYDGGSPEGVPYFVWQHQVYFGRVEDVLRAVGPLYYED